MNNGYLEGILHIGDERQDGQLRDPLQPGRRDNDRNDAISVTHRQISAVI